MRLIDNAWQEFHRLWSIRTGLFFFVLNGALIGLAAFGEVLNPYLFMGLNMSGYALIGAMRLLKQAPTVPTTPEAALHNPLPLRADPPANATFPALEPAK